MNNMTDTENRKEKDDSAEDLYQDLPDFQFEEQLIQLEKNSKEASLLSVKVKELAEENSRLQNDNDTLKFNISALQNTAKTEVDRKNNIINELRRELEAIKFRRNNKNIKREESTNTEAIEIQNEMSEGKKVFEGRRWEHVTFNGRNSVSSTSSGSKLSEYDEEKLCYHSKDRVKEHIDDKREDCYRKKSNSREGDDRSDYNGGGRKSDQGREDESSRRRNLKEENSYSRSRYDRFREGFRGRGRKFDKYGSRFGSRYESSHRVELHRNPKHHSNELRRRSRERRPEKRSTSRDRRRRSSSPDRRKRSNSPDRRKRSSSPDRRKRSHSPDRRKRSSSPDRRKRSNSPDRRKRSNSPDRRKRSSSQGRRRRSCDRRRSRERYKNETDSNRDYPKDIKLEENNIKSQNLFTDKRDSKKLREENVVQKIETIKTGVSDVKRGPSSEIKKSGQEKNKVSDKSSATENKCSVDIKKEARDESKSHLEEKSNSKPRNKIDCSEYIRRKNCLADGEKNNKKFSLSAQSPLEALYNEMERSIGSSRIKNTGIVSFKNLDDANDYGEDWALSFKNERPNVSRPKTLYSKRMEERLMAMESSAQKKINEIPPKNENHLKEEIIARNNLNEGKRLKNQIENLFGNTSECSERIKVDVVPEHPKKVSKLNKEKELGEITDEESDEFTKEEYVNDGNNVTVVNDVSNALNYSTDLKEKQSTETIVTDSSSGTDTVLEPPKTPDIRESQNNSSLNDAIVNLYKSDEILQKLEENALEKILQTTLEPSTEITGDQTMKEMMDKLCGERNGSEFQKPEEFSPFKNNYRLIKLSPLKPLQRGKNIELYKFIEAQKTFEKTRKNIIITPEKLEVSSAITVGKTNENGTTATVLQHFDTPKKSDFCNQEDSSLIDHNSSGNNTLNEPLESSSDLTLQTSKELDSDEKKTEESQLGTTVSLEINENDSVIENLSGTSVKPKSNRKRTTSHSKRSGSKRKKSKESNKKLDKEKSKADPVLEKNNETNTKVYTLNQIKEVSVHVEKFSMETRSSQRQEICKKRKSPDKMPEISTRSLRARKSKSKEPPEEKILIKEEPRARNSTPVRNPKTKEPPEEKTHIKEEPRTRKSTPVRNPKRKRENSAEKPNNKSKESSKKKKVDIKNDETTLKSNKKSKKADNVSASIFSPLPNKSSPMELMTPRRMLKNDLMLTDSEDEAPVSPKVAETVTVVETEKHAETVEYIETMEQVEIVEHIETVETVDFVENTENTVCMENAGNVKSEEWDDESFSESEDFSDPDASEFIDLL